MDFPHINDDNFPHLDNVDVWKFQNEFDYARWQGKISIKLINVLWNSNYADVPYFESDAKRDEWFDEQEGIFQVLTSAFNITPENTVTVPIPYNDAFRFNYLVVDMPMQTSSKNPIDYENANTRIQRWYYFIDSMSQYAPNTTELYITLDAWTTFSHIVEIPYLMLERGHAPMFQTEVDDYLDCPIDNNEYLLADDFNYGGESKVISTSTYIPIGSGKKYVIFALPMTQTDLLAIGGAVVSGDSTAPTFSDIATREGYQLQVNNYAWNYGNVDYSNAQLDITSMLSDEAVFNGNYMFAIDSDKAHSFFNLMAAKCVHLLHAIQACFMVAEDMISLGTGFSFGDYTLYQCDRNFSSFDCTLNKEAFGFDEKYSEITKLYTYPYSILEVTDDNGFKREVRIENTGSIKFHQEVSIAFPYLRYQVFFTGFNGSGDDISYYWKNIHDTDVLKEIWEDDFSEFMMKWDIPIFALYVSSENEYAVNNYAPMKAAREGAIIAYQNAVRYANTDYENVDDTTDAMVTNVNEQNIANNDIVDNSNTASRNNTARGNLASYNNSESNITKLSDDHVTDTQLSASLTAIQNDVLATSTMLNNGTSIDVAGLGAMGAATMNPMSVGNGIGQIVGSVITANTATATTGLVIGSNISGLIDVAGANTNKFAHARDNIRAVTSETNNAHTDITNNSCNALTLNTGRQNTVDMVKIVNTTQVMDANANYSRNATVAAEQDNLRQKQREWAAKYKSNRLAKPFMETDFSGDAFPDLYQRRGVRLNLRTQSKSAIAQAGDAFLRYGYALHRVWDMSNGFHYGKYFTFWKAEDLWINEGTGIAGNAVNIIGQILMKGVTVWRNPEKIGQVSIYDNFDIN